MGNTRRNFIFGAAAAITAGYFMWEKRRYSVEEQIEYGIEIINSHNPEKYLGSPYVASVLCYSTAYINKLLLSKNSEFSPNVKILRTLASKIRPEDRRSFFNYHINDINSRLPDEALSSWSSPLKEYSDGIGNNHKDALDLFAPEGNEVLSIFSGKVLVSENDWSPTDQLSTSSNKGGNVVVILSPKGLIPRSAHLAESTVKTGQLILAGSQIGFVGNTGENANKPGHGRHLHLEINQLSIDRTYIQSIPAQKIKHILKFGPDR